MVPDIIIYNWPCINTVEIELFFVVPLINNEQMWITYSIFLFSSKKQEISGIIMLYMSFFASSNQLTSTHGTCYEVHAI